MINELCLMIIDILCLKALIITFIKNLNCTEQNPMIITTTTVLTIYSSSINATAASSSRKSTQASGVDAAKTNDPLLLISPQVH